GYEAISLDGAEVHEHVGASFAGDEAVPLCIVEPLHGASYASHERTSCRKTVIPDAKRVIATLAARAPRHSRAGRLGRWRAKSVHRTFTAARPRTPPAAMNRVAR